MDPSIVGLPDFRNNFINPDGEFVMSNSYNCPLSTYEVPSLDINLPNSSLEFPLCYKSGIFIPPPIESLDGVSVNESADCSPKRERGGQFLFNPDDNDFFAPVLNYINQMLMEENIQENDCISYDPLALQETEKSLYEALGNSCPPSACQPYGFRNRRVESPASHFSFNRSEYFSTGNSSTSSSDSLDSKWFADVGEHTPSGVQALDSRNFTSQSALLSDVQLSFNSSRACLVNSNALSTSSFESIRVQNLLSGRDKTALVANEGLQEVSPFLPQGGSVIIDFGKNAVSARQKEYFSKAGILSPNDHPSSFPKGSTGRKFHERDDMNAEVGRGSKQCASSVDDGELSEMFDRVLLCCEDTKYTVNGIEQDGVRKIVQPSGQLQGSRGRKTNARKQGKRKDTVDLRSLLLLCAQAISTDDRRTSTELLKQIRQHYNHQGDASQRLAYYFANALEARLGGTTAETQDFYTSQTINRTTAINAMRAFHCYITACPFRKFSIFFASKMILKTAEKAKTLHIVDFGILDGFHWPILIQDLSGRPGGPPNLRITGIEFPQSGFRPRERIEKTGDRLAKYCDRFKVPFEYNGIVSQKWETIQMEDLKIDRNEVLAVNCPLRFKNMLDESVEANSPRDAVLKLIRKMNPRIIVHSILNGSHNTPFFLTRFREALFHFSALFDMFDAIVSRESEERFKFESKFYGKDIMNIIACEGYERVERPETYKQWQTRKLRAGFTQLPLDQDLMRDFRAKLKESYNKDFVLDEDSNWMLLGWRGRILYASSCWAPAKVS